MTPVLFPEMAHSTFQPLLDRLEEDRHKPEISPNEARDLLIACGFGAAVLDKLGELMDQILRRGMESAKFRSLLKEFTEVIDLAAKKVYPQVRSIAAGAALATAERLAALQTLDAYSARATKMQAELASLKRLLETPPPRVDPESLLGATDSAGQKRYTDLDEIISRLTAGGDI